MPTSAENRRQRFLASGHFKEKPGYRVDRPGGCHDWLLIYTAGGSGKFSYGEEGFVSSAHELVLIAPGTSHVYAVAPKANRWELLWAHFLPPDDWRPWLKWPGPAKGWGRIRLQGKSRQQEIRERFREVIRLAASYRFHRESLAINALAGVIISCHEQVANLPGHGLDPRLADVLDHICRHLDQSLEVQTLARLCHLSPSRFAHLFREQMQMTPQQFVERQRLERARELLEHTGYSIGDIARQVGFDNPFYFSRRFKQAIGTSPREYRRGLDNLTQT